MKVRNLDNRLAEDDSAAPATWGALRQALDVWGYALARSLVNDQIKLLAYRIFDQQLPGLLKTRQR